MQCPADFTAVAVVVALSSLIGARATVSPKAQDDWQAVPNLWGLVIGNPGVMKSPAMLEAIKPLSNLEYAERKAHQVKHDEWMLDNELEKMAADTKRNEAKNLAVTNRKKARELLTPSEAIPGPVARRYTVNDATVEKLQEILVDSSWGLLVFRDELHGLISAMDRPGQEGSRGFYLTGYDGKTDYTTDRIIRGNNHIPRVCLSMLGGIQPGKIQSYIREAVNGGAGDDGLLQRFGLTVWPDISRDFTYVDRKPDSQARERAEAVFARLNELQPTEEGESQVWRFSPEAQDLFEQWLVPFETEIRGAELHPALVSHLAKYRKLIPALALIFALVDTPDSGCVIHERELARTLDWYEYLRTHAERLYSAALRPDTHGAKQLLSKIRGGHLKVDAAIPQSFTPREVVHKNWAGLGSTDAVYKAADLLADYGWLEKEVVTSADVLGRGRRSTRYWIHPGLLKGGA
jgi:putative DNA primase/helicase